MDVAIQVLSYKEQNLDETLDAYASLHVPSFVDTVGYHACVTPRESYTAHMAEHAERHPVFEFIETPPGKLSSRNVAHDTALERDYDVIVSGDGDARPVDASYLESLLEPFTDPGVAGVTGTQYDDNPVTFPISHLAYEIDLFRRPIYGRSSAFTADAWERAGPFDESVDQTDVYETRGEEEFDFRRRIERVGAFHIAKDANVHSDLRRPICHLQQQWSKAGRHVSPYCQRSGTETFHTR